MKWMITMKSGVCCTLVGDECKKLNKAFLSGKPLCKVTPVDYGKSVEIKLDLIEKVERVIPPKSCENCIHLADSCDECKCNMAAFRGYCDGWKISEVEDDNKIRRVIEPEEWE